MAIVKCNVHEDTQKGPSGVPVAGSSWRGALGDPLDVSLSTHLFFLFGGGRGELVLMVEDWGDILK